MITINSVSGGKTSSYIAMNYRADYNVFSLVCIDEIACAPKDKSIIDYANRKLGDEYVKEFGEFIATAEDDKTLYVMRDLEQKLGTNITWVRGKSFDDIIDERHQRVLLGNRKRLPSWARRYCTIEMKMEPIFYWWFKHISEKANMRIGFRFDEYDRMERFFNNSDPINFKIPISTRIYGQKLQTHETFNWRFCHFPLIKNAIIKENINEYWDKNSLIEGDLFTPDRYIDFPVVSNCVGCFHKNIETIAAMAELHPEKIKWFADQENKNMGTWLDSKKTYSEIIANKESLYKEVLYEIKTLGKSCDSGGCHD